MNRTVKSVMLPCHLANFFQPGKSHVSAFQELGLCMYSQAALIPGAAHVADFAKSFVT